VLEGQEVDVELEEAIKAHGLFGGIQVMLWRRHYAQIERDFLTAGLPPGVDLPVLDLEIEK
jgi:hypothetical protein